MGILERMKGFGRRRRPCVGNDATLDVVPPPANPGASAMGTLWSSEDYLAPNETVADVQDHWSDPASTARRHEGGAAIADVSRVDGEVEFPNVDVSRLEEVAESAVADQPDAWGESEGVVLVTAADVPTDHRAREWSFGDDPAFDDFLDPVEWMESATNGHDHVDPDLPFFDPGASAAPVVADVFAGRHVWRVGTKAGILALATAIPDRRGREQAARVFETALNEGRWPEFFRSWLRLAPTLECPHTIALAVELKEHWDDSPHLWRFRDAPGRPTRQHEGARNQFGWRRALAMAEARTHEPAWRILDDDLVADWEELKEPCPGFWSLAEWLEVMCRGDEAEIHSLGLLAATGRGRRALHLQDLCERLGLGRTGASSGRETAPVVDGNVATFPFRNDHLRPAAGARAGTARTERRAPTPEEMRMREVE